MSHNLLLQPEVETLTRLSGTTLWRLEREGKFPKRLKIGGTGRNGRVAWSQQEIEVWLVERMAARQPNTA